MQKRLFTELNNAVAALHRELKANGKWNEVLLRTFSEFGRRVAQYASGGTDQGTANNHLFMRRPKKGEYAPFHETYLNQAPSRGAPVTLLKKSFRETQQLLSGLPEVMGDYA